MSLRTRDFETGQKAPKEVGRNRKKTERKGGTGFSVSPSLYLFGPDRQGLLHNLLHSARINRVRAEEEKAAAWFEKSYPDPRAEWPPGDDRGRRSRSVTVTVLVRRPRKRPEGKGPRVLCAECGYEFGLRKQDHELRGPRRCPKCRARLVPQGSVTAAGQKEPQRNAT